MAAHLDHGLNWMRRRQRLLTRAVLALFCLSWLQVAALPCAMAYAPASVDAAVEHCPYCPTDCGPAPPADGHGGCAYPHEPQVDARPALPLCIAIPVSSFSLPAAADDVERSARFVALPQAIPRPPLSLSYCRFIE